MAKFLDYDGLKRFHAAIKAAIDKAATTAKASSVTFSDGGNLQDKSYLELSKNEYDELEKRL